MLPDEEDVLFTNYKRFLKDLPYKDILNLKLQLIYERKEYIDFAIKNFDYILKNVPYFIKRITLQYFSLNDLKNFKIAVGKNTLG